MIPIERLDYEKLLEAKGGERADTCSVPLWPIIMPRFSEI